VNSAGNGTSLTAAPSGSSFTFTVPNFVADTYYIRVDNYSQLSDPVMFSLVPAAPSGTNTSYNAGSGLQTSQLGSIINSLGAILELLQRTLR
jgi:hypothetical protein